MSSELQLEGIEVDSAAEPEVPIAPDSALDKRMDWRYLDLRRPDRHLIFEVQTAVDLLTTNETYFFREPKHFELLRSLAAAAAGQAQPFRVWSAASSSGEECYSIAMVLADCLGDAGWDVPVIGHPYPSTTPRSSAV